MSKYYTLKYKCRICLEIHESKDAAENCCAEKVESVYECGDCGIRHSTYYAVKTCCREVKPCSQNEN